MTRPWNFSAGPSALPLDVLEQAAREMTDWQGSGMSVMEMSHRGKHFTRIRDEAVADLRELLAVPEDFEILFMQGGATAENAIIPMNLIGRNGAGKADYILSGSWSNKSYKEAQRYGDIALAASSGDPATIDGREQAAWTWFPSSETWKVRPDAAYLHLCGNETIGGVEFAHWPAMADVGAPEVPLVVDVSSHFLSRPIDFSKVGMVYAGAQKNAGPAGVTVVVVRKDLIGHALSICPTAFDYANVAAAGSMFNTPPTYAIYIAGLVFKWLKRKGGVAAIEAENIRKARVLWFSGRFRLLPEHCARARALAHERAVFSRGRVPERKISFPGGCTGPAAAQGSQERGRHACLHLQCRAFRRRAGTHYLHAGIRTTIWITLCSPACSPCVNVSMQSMNRFLSCSMSVPVPRRP